VAVACTQVPSGNGHHDIAEGPQGWRGHINGMVLRGAQLTPTEADTVVDYLATVFGPGVSLPPPARSTAGRPGQGRRGDRTAPSATISAASSAPRDRVTNGAARSRR